MELVQTLLFITVLVAMFHHIRTDALKQWRSDMRACTLIAAAFIALAITNMGLPIMWLQLAVAVAFGIMAQRRQRWWEEAVALEAEKEAARRRKVDGL